MSKNRSQSFYAFLAVSLFSSGLTVTTPRVFAEQAGQSSDEAKQEESTPVRGVAAIVQRGYACITKGDYRSAIATFNQAVGLDPKNKDARRYLAYALCSSGDTTRAIEQMNALSKITLLTSFDHIIYGQIYYATGNYHEAQISYQQAVQLDPSSDQARTGLVNAFAVAALWEKAFRECQEGYQSAKTDKQRQYYKALYNRVELSKQQPQTNASGAPMQVSGAVMSLPPRSRNPDSAE